MLFALMCVLATFTTDVMFRKTAFPSCRARNIERCLYCLVAFCVATIPPSEKFDHSMKHRSPIMRTLHILASRFICRCKGQVEATNASQRVRSRRPQASTTTLTIVG